LLYLLFKELSRQSKIASEEAISADIRKTCRMLTASFIQNYSLFSHNNNNFSKSKTVVKGFPCGKTFDYPSRSEG
jgi:hypothetical protein